MSSSVTSDDEHEEKEADEDVGAPFLVIPERKAKSVCDESKSRPNHDNSRESLPSEAATHRKPSLGYTTSLPLPQRSLSQGETGAPPKQPGSKPLQRCPTVHNPTSGNNSKQNQEQKTNGNNGTNAGTAANNQGGAPGASTTKRKESVTWSPFGALGKAMSSGVNIVGDATKAVGTGVVQGTKAVGSGVVTGTKAVGSGVVSVGTGVVKTATAVGDGVIEGTKVVGSGIVDVTEYTASAAVSGAKAVGSATVSTVNATVDETTNFVREKKRSVNRHMRRTMTYTAGEGDTLGVIAAKYKTTCEDLIELNPQLADRRVQHGEELLVPVGGSRKMSKQKDQNFLQGLSMGLLEDDDEGEGSDMTDTRCLINSNAEYGPKVVTHGWMMIDNSQLTLSWAREDPLILSADDINNIALIYGSLEMPEFLPLLEQRTDHSTGLSMSEEVFPVYDEEAELELDSVSGEVEQIELAEAGRDDGALPGEDKETDDSALLDDTDAKGRDKNGSLDEDETMERAENETRKLSRGSRRASRRRTISKERRQSLLFEDQMATYCYVEVLEGFIPATKSKAVLQEEGQSGSFQSGSEHLSSSNSVEGAAPVSPLWTLNNNTPSFIIRVPNESIIKLFSFLIRHYKTQYICCELPLDPLLGFTSLTMDTLQTKCGDAKIGAKLNSSVDGEMETDEHEAAHKPLPTLVGDSSILEDEDIEQLRDRLPSRLENNDWTLAFTTARDGFALSTLYRKVQDLDCPILMVIQDVDQVIFGGLLSEPPKVTDSFAGTGESWLFSIDAETGDLSVFKWTTKNQLFIKGSNENLVIGSGGGQFGLWFDADLNKGRTQRCETFDNPPLTPSSDFCVYCLECWAFLPST